MGTTAKIVSFGSKHEEIPPVPLPPVQLERSKRRGSVLRREALERLQQGKGGSLGDKDDGGLPGGGRRGVPSGELILRTKYTCSTMHRSLKHKTPWPPGLQAYCALHICSTTVHRFILYGATSALH